MHYGMNVVLINSLDEVLCVNQHQEVLCKTEDQLENNDEICFKIVDLTDPSNPGLGIYLSCLLNRSRTLGLWKAHLAPDSQFGGR